MRLGRNDPCYCGSGKKYKKCHLEPDHDASQAFQEALPMLLERQARSAAMKEKLRSEYSVYINFALPVQWDGGKAWAIGPRVYPHRPTGETFHEFLISLLRETFSEQWRASQVTLPENRQHFLMKCSNEWAKFKAANSTTIDAEGLFSGVPNGWVQYLISLAWDVGTLIHATQLPASLIERLRDHDQFQGARYEVAVAAIFARLDCEVQFLDDHELRGQKHPEFVATHRSTGLQVAVEAKSRHRHGIINFAGSYDADAIVRGDAQGLFDKALAKAPEDMPFVILIDANAPPALKSGVENQWQTDIKEWMNERYASGAHESEPYSAFAGTNFSPHYDGDDIAQGVEWLYFDAPNPKFSLPHEFSRMLRQALDQYHRVPEISEDGEVRG